MDATMLWVLEENGAVLSESYLVTYTEGDTLSVWTNHSGEIASAHGSSLESFARAAAMPLQLLAPRPLEAQFFWDCRHEWMEYLGAAFVAKLAIAAAFASPSLPTITAAVLAVGLVVSLGEELVDCFAEHDN